MSNLIIALLFGLGSGAWIYNKFLRTSGNNQKNSIIGAVIIGLLLALILDFILSSIIKKG
jgi:predicted ABC-type exoprotein transport system permease subunit